MIGGISIGILFLHYGGKHCLLAECHYCWGDGAIISPLIISTYGILILTVTLLQGNPSGFLHKEACCNAHDSNSDGDPNNGLRCSDNTVRHEEYGKNYSNCTASKRRKMHESSLDIISKGFGIAAASREVLKAWIGNRNELREVLSAR
jgi:hypothetical protein